ncbi:hypothetical protein [Saccharothrix sp.]|uniref:hypothetical protein n=1 Tax=Saccharothrix sp. TaxID=1873460 RepID=UPI002810C3E3|nr:hypothetical protein [Saccharothrix sp.]
MITYKHVAFALLEAEMLSHGQVRAVLDKFADYVDDHLDPYEVAYALEEFGVAVAVHADDVDFLEESYAHILEQAAALTRGAVTVTDVRLREGEFVEGSRDDVLEFTVNGRPVSISAEHYSDEYLDHLAATEAVDELNPGDARTFRLVDFARERNRGYETILTLATPEQAAVLEENLGLKLR